MSDFSQISHGISFNYGPRIDIWDFMCPEYMVEFYEMVEGGWGVQNVYMPLYPNHFFLNNGSRYRNQWKIKVWGWINGEPTQLLEHTYDEKNKQIKIVFDSDNFKEHIIWYNLSKKFQDDFACKVIISSEFSDRLISLFGDKQILFLNDSNDNNIYATYHIGRYNIPHHPNHEWGSGFMNPNQSRPKMSFDHPNDWYPLTSEELFNDIMNL